MIKCIAIDDEPLALDIIDKFCRRTGNIELLTFSDPAEGLETIRRQRPDIAFLDIEMENINGLTIASMLPEETCFIFTTAYLHYAVDGFNLDAVDYLHKPFAYSRFKTAFDRALRRKGYPAPPAQEKYISVKQEYNTVRIPVNEIMYVEALEGYSKIFRTDGQCTVTRVLLKNIGAMLPDSFIRIHRSYIVSRDKIKSYTRQNVNLMSGKTLPVGRQYTGNLQ